MRRFTPLLAVLTFLAAVLACDADPPDLSVPDAHAAGMELAVQEADSFDVIATWSPVVFNGDTIREYLRSTGYDDGSWNSIDTLQAVGSETLRMPSPSEGETVSGYYCLESVRRLDDGTAVLAPDSVDNAACTSFQYTSPYSYPPPPDSLEVNPQVALAFDSIVTSPKLIQARPLRNPEGVAWPDSDMVVARGGFHMDVIGKPDSTWNDSATVWRRKFASGRVIYDTTPDNRLADFATARIFDGGQVVGCLGYCDTVTISAATWDRGAPVYIAGRPGYGLSEYVARRLPWLRVHNTYRG